MIIPARSSGWFPQQAGRQANWLARLPELGVVDESLEGGSKSRWIPQQANRARGGGHRSALAGKGSQTLTLCEFPWFWFIACNRDNTENRHGWLEPQRQGRNAEKGQRSGKQHFCCRATGSCQGPNIQLLWEGSQNYRRKRLLQKLGRNPKSRLREIIQPGVRIVVKKTNRLFSLPGEIACMGFVLRTSSMSGKSSCLELRCHLTASYSVNKIKTIPLCMEWDGIPAKEFHIVSRLDWI